MASVKPRQHFVGLLQYMDGWLFLTSTQSILVSSFLSQARGNHFLTGGQGQKSSFIISPHPLKLCWLLQILGMLADPLTRPPRALVLSVINIIVFVLSYMPFSVCFTHTHIYIYIYVLFRCVHYCLCWSYIFSCILYYVICAFDMY